MTARDRTHRVDIGGIPVGGGAPVRVQSMTNTDTADVESTFTQTLALAEAGSEFVRITVNNDAAAAAVPEIVKRLRDAGCGVPLIGDFHFNGHKLLAEHPQCASDLSKYRINPGNVGAGRRRDDNFNTICRIAADNGKPVRIGVNGGSLNPELVELRMAENTRDDKGLDSAQVLNLCMVESALTSTELALEAGLTVNDIIISCKVSRVPDLLTVYRELSARTRQPLHLGLTEAGMGDKGVVASSGALAILLAEGIGDTIRVSLTPEPGGDRRREVRVAQEILQSLDLRAFTPQVTACPGCGRTTSTTFQVLAREIEDWLVASRAGWSKTHPGSESLKVAVMGCIVNGPGESKEADIGISLPGTGEAPKCPVYIDGEMHSSLQGTPEELAREFRALVQGYVDRKFGGVPA